MKYRGFETESSSKKIISWWKGLVIFLLLIPILSFFSFVETIYADKQKVLSLFQFNNYYKNFIPYQLGNLVANYKSHKNLKNNIAWVLFLLNHPVFLSSVLNVDVNQLSKIFKIIKGNFNDFLNIVWFDTERTYLIILENTAEERPDGGFFGSFAKVSLSGWYITDFKLYDSYFLLWKYCKQHTKNLPAKNWFKYCNKSWLNLDNNIYPFNQLFPKTTFLTSNIFGFTSLNAKNIISHYNKVFNDKIDGVIFVKSDILRYLLKDWDKIFLQMEYLNYLSKEKNNLVSYNNPNLKWLKWKKARYLLYLNNLLTKNKFDLIRNFVNNFTKIQNKGLIRFYLPFVSTWFKKFLIKNNFSLEKQKDYVYFFFYNVGFVKNSHFIDHIVKINDKVYINPVKIKIWPWVYKIWIKHIYNPNYEYISFLKQKGVTENSYLISTKVKYKNLIILPSYCTLKDKTNNFYLVYCK